MVQDRHTLPSESSLCSLQKEVRKNLPVPFGEESCNTLFGRSSVPVWPVHATARHCHHVQGVWCLANLFRGWRGGGSVHCTAWAALFLVPHYQRSTSGLPPQSLLKPWKPQSPWLRLAWTEMHQPLRYRLCSQAETEAHRMLHTDTHIKLSGRVSPTHFHLSRCRWRSRYA